MKPVDDELNLFERTHKAISEVRDKINGMTFDQAANALGGYNCDGELFDYDYPIDDGYYFVGTIHNQDGKAYMDTDDSFYDVWYATDMLNARQVLAMTKQEILEQIDRLQ